MEPRGVQNQGQQPIQFQQVQRVQQKNNATVETLNPDTDNKLNKKVKVNSVNKYLIVKAETRTMEGKTNKPAYDGGLDPGELA